MDSTQDAEMEKLLDSLIDEKMQEGKTDEQILAELGAITGLTSERHAKTPEELKKYEQSLHDDIKKSLNEDDKQKAFERLSQASFPGQDSFDDFTTRHSEMRFDADTIIISKTRDRTGLKSGEIN